MENFFCVDFLTFTVKHPAGMEHGGAVGVMTWLIRQFAKITDGFICEDKFEFVNYGRFSFDRMARFGGQNTFYLCTSESGKMSDYVMVSVSGRGVQDIGTDYLVKIITYAHDVLNAHFTRIDLAYDDYTGVVPVKRLVSAFNRYLKGRNNIETRYKKDTVTIYKGVYDEVPFTNFSFGSRESTQYLRLYDKRAEQGQKGETDLPVYWYRLEMECRKEAAQTVADGLCSNGFEIGPVYFSFLNRMFRVLERDLTVTEAKNKSRVKTASWWLDFTQNDLKGKLHRVYPSVDNDIDRMFIHVRDNYSGYLYTLFTVAPHRLQGIIEMAGQEQALKPKYQRILQGNYDEEF